MYNISMTKTTKQFIEEVKQVHGDKYDYSLVEYIKAKDKVTIICPKHGEFRQSPDKHLAGKGCKNCGVTSSSSKRRYSKEKFIELCNNVHNNKYNYEKTDYHSCYDKITVTCPFHGDFIQEASKHISGHGCQKCSNERIGNSKKSNKYNFIEKSNLSHNNKYNYSKVEYNKAKEKVTIICPEHGEFEQTPSNHIKGKGCPTCKAENSSIFNVRWLEDHPNQTKRTVILYLIKIESNNESFLKLGLTNRSVKQRFQYGLNLYEYETLREEEISIQNAILIEQEAKNEYKSSKYTPKDKFPGWTECYNINTLDQLTSLINTYIYYLNK